MSQKKQYGFFGFEIIKPENKSFEYYAMLIRGMLASCKKEGYNYKLITKKDRLFVIVSDFDILRQQIQEQKLQMFLEKVDVATVGKFGLQPND